MVGWVGQVMRFCWPKWPKVLNFGAVRNYNDDCELFSPMSNAHAYGAKRTLAARIDRFRLRQWH